MARLGLSLAESGHLLRRVKLFVPQKPKEASRAVQCPARRRGCGLTGSCPQA